MAWKPPDSVSEYENWDVENHDEWAFLGTVNEGQTAVLYDSDRSQVHRGTIDEEERLLVPETEPSWELDPGESVGQFLERVGNETGWDSLSEFARENLEDDSN